MATGDAVDGDGGGAGGTHDDERLHLAPASPHSHGVNAVASVESPLHEERVRERHFFSRPRDRDFINLPPLV